MKILYRVDQQLPKPNWHRAHFWRMRGEEIRTLAGDMTHPETKAIMLWIANDYERLAKKAEEDCAANSK